MKNLLLIGIIIFQLGSYTQAQQNKYFKRAYIVEHEKGNIEAIMI